MNILITGGTGSFGRAFVRRVLKDNPARVVVYSRDELKQSQMREEFPQDCMRFFIGDVRDRDRLEMALYGIDTVVHAAALKQVPVAEYNPFECIRTNVGGAENVVRASMACGVKRVIALSSDKAVAPINLYGASKLCADKIFVAANQGARGTHYSVVRYGNVIGSRGSVVALYKRLIAGGSTELPITDERMTRFWITVEQGVEFVLTALREMKGGEIFVPRLPSMKIVDMARAMAPECKFKEIGIRPGEKLHEVLMSEHDLNCLVPELGMFIVAPPMFSERNQWSTDRRINPWRIGEKYASDTNTEWLTREAFLSLAGLAGGQMPSAEQVLRQGLAIGNKHWLFQQTAAANPHPLQSLQDTER